MPILALSKFKIEPGFEDVCAFKEHLSLGTLTGI